MENNFENTLAQSLQMTGKLHQALETILRSTNVPQKRTPQSNHVKVQPFNGQISQTHDKKINKHSRHISDKLNRIQMNESLQSYQQYDIQNTVIYQENNILKKQNEELKDKLREMSQKQKNYRKYINFLQNYNDSLKKQVITWMNRPTKYDLPQQNSYSNSLIFAKLQQKVNPLRNQIKQLNPQKQQIRQLSESQDSIQPSPRAYNFSQVIHPKKHIHHRSNIAGNQSMIINKKQNPCTSCNYYQMKDVINKKKTFKPNEYLNSSNHKTKHKKKARNTKNHSNLCQCHKRYIDKSYF